MKIVLKFKIIHYYICYIVGLFYIELLYWRDRMRGVGSVKQKGKILLPIHNIFLCT